MNQSQNNRSDSSTTGKTIPSLIVAGVVIASIFLQTVLDLLDALQWHREASPVTRSFDWMTGHLVHWSWNHLLWDLAAFLMLSVVAIRLSSGRFMLSLLAAAVAIPLEIALNQPQIFTYRGLSGIDSAIFGLIVAALWQSSKGQSLHFPWNRVVAVVAGLSFLAKFGFELVTGGTLFVASASGDQAFVAVPSAHLIGAVVGFFAGSIRNRSGFTQKKTRQIRSEPVSDPIA